MRLKSRGHSTWETSARNTFPPTLKSAPQVQMTRKCITYSKPTQPEICTWKHHIFSSLKVGLKPIHVNTMLSDGHLSYTADHRRGVTSWIGASISAPFPRCRLPLVCSVWFWISSQVSSVCDNGRQPSGSDGSKTNQQIWSRLGWGWYWRRTMFTFGCKLPATFSGASRKPEHHELALSNQFVYSR